MADLGMQRQAVISQICCVSPDASHTLAPDLAKPDYYTTTPLLRTINHTSTTLKKQAQAARS
jgi:hypothetical protein